jgi:hypothetical protein
MRTSLNIITLCMIGVLMVAALSVHAGGYDTFSETSAVLFP